MERDYGKEIDDLKKSVAEILSIVKKEEKEQAEKDEADENVSLKKKEMEDIPRTKVMHKDSRINEFAQELIDEYRHKSGGRVMSIGSFSASGHQSTWVSEYPDIEGAFDVIHSGVAEKVLKCIGNNSRLSLILTLLKKPMSVNQLIEDCGYTSTGQVYYHLQPLINGDIVVEDEFERGVYMIQGHQVQGIITILLGISDIIGHGDDKGKGTWDE